MKYTNRVKLSVMADILSVTVLAFTALLIITEKVTMKSMAILIIIILIAGTICFSADLYKSRGACRKWRNIWKDPIWQQVVYIALAIALVISVWVSPETYYIGNLMCVLIMANALIRDIRYYRYAIRFSMDELEDVNELAQKYPEARPMINRKKKDK